MFRGVPLIYFIVLKGDFILTEYFAYNCTVIGQRYIEKEKPCEDSSISYDSENIKIAIIADGHGDKKCFRSNIGSRIACEVSLEKMKDFAFALQNENVEDQIFNEKRAEKLISHLFISIVSSWKEKVLQDLSDNPPSDEEYESAGDNNAAIYKAGNGLTHIYGTTLIAMLMTERYLLVIHQGDGRCVVMHNDGIIDQPVPWDPRCEGRNTASLCDEDVLAHWRYHLIDLSKDTIVACYAVSDGIEDSFETQKEVNAYLCMHAADYAELGKDAYLEALPQHFSILTKQGSQDDISIGCIINNELAAIHAKRFKLIHEFYVFKAENRKANERLNSMQRKTDYLTQQLNEAQSNYDIIVHDESKSKSLIEKLSSALKSETDGLTKTSEKKKLAEEKLAQIQKEYDEYMSIRDEFVKKAEESQASMDELSEQISDIQLKPSDKEQNNDEYTPIYTQPETDDEEFDNSLCQSESSQDININDEEVDNSSKESQVSNHG